MRKITYFIFCGILGLTAITFGTLVYAQEVDTTPPARVDNLSVTETSISSTTLSWLVPGDDGMDGTAASYDLRYATSTITDLAWGGANQVTNEPVPQAASSTQTLVVTGLNSETTYYFAIKTKDEADNESELSNVASATTLALPEPGPGVDETFQMNVSPESLNLSSQGRWITVHLFLPAPYKAGDVDTSNVKLNDTLSPDPSYKGLNHFQKGRKDTGQQAGNLVLKFSRSEFITLVGSATGDFEVKLTGKVNGTSFEATDTVKILAAETESDGALIQSQEDDEVYEVSNGRKRHIPSPAAFERRGYRWGNIKRVSQATLDSYNDDELIKASDSPVVYLLIAGMKRHIPSVEVFESYGFDWNDISVVSPDEVNDYPDVVLIRGAGEVNVYLLAGGKKHWIPSVAIFNSRGYKWDQIIIVNLTEKNALSDGDAVE